MENDFLLEARNRLATMRLVIQGAVSLYENECLALYSAAKSAGQEEAAIAFDTIGTALYALQMQVADLQAWGAE